MEEEKNCFYISIWIIGIGMIILSLIGCRKINNDNYVEVFIHSCPESGHGDCPICCDPYINEKTIALD